MTVFENVHDIEKMLDHWWDTLGKHSLLDYLNQEQQTGLPIPKPPRENSVRFTEHTSPNDEVEPDQFDLDAIKWLDKNRDPAPMQTQWAWAYAFDTKGEIHPECEALYNEVQRYGEVHTQGFIISLGGRDKQLLNKRIPKKENGS